MGAAVFIVFLISVGLMFYTNKDARDFDKINQERIDQGLPYDQSAYGSYRNHEAGPENGAGKVQELAGVGAVVSGLILLIMLLSGTDQI
jgi:hypothetical protein